MTARRPTSPDWCPSDEKENSLISVNRAINNQ
jgi:hypothetical protein